MRNSKGILFLGVLVITLFLISSCSKPVGVSVKNDLINCNEPSCNEKNSEQYCYKSSWKDCESGQLCEDGKCIPKKCIDSDDGKSYDKAGEISGISKRDKKYYKSVEDKCAPTAAAKDRVIEFFCINELQFDSVMYKCNNACKDGACI